MNASEIIASLLSLAAGIGIFMMACSVMSSNLETLSSDKLREMFARVSGNKIVGVGIGALATAMIQSSGATAVMIIGFVNAGILPLSQAATILYGGEIGTTLTGQLVALGMNGGGAISASVIFSAFAGIGMFVSLFAKKDTVKAAGGAMTGFGMIFVGLEMMSGAMEAFSKLDGLKTFLAGVSSTWLLIVAGAVLTAVVQSSSAMTSIAITMVSAGLISLEQGIYLTLGANVGSCITGLMAALGSSVSARRTSVLQLIFNVGGVVLLALADSAGKLLGGRGIAHLFEIWFPSAPHTQLAMFHTVFNVLSVAAALPINELLVSLATRLVRERPETKKTPELRFRYVDEYMLATPPVAVQQVKREVLAMADTAMRNFNRSIETVCTLDYSEVSAFRKDEELLDWLSNELVAVIVRLSGLSLSERDHLYLGTTYHTITDLERIGDYAENVIEYADALREKGEPFTEGAIEEIRTVTRMINDVYRYVREAYEDGKIAAVRYANVIEERVDDYTDAMEERHLKRLSQGECSAYAGTQFLSLTWDAERISDHLINMADEVEKW